ncbi:hypothetical protein ALP66_103084 [Pseudomonas amygdali pv. photiniae]|uniref:Uncharacterized protein n=9 Tax=Pseudomonas syringae group TaxID=136849 RepID=A0A3M5FJ85_PSESS|nr:hypothetical protein ALO78_102378 [Pseudomonas amygdali pv. ciccaronei]KPW91393.1 hypothetical protein ALO79_100754 [Pseudomonas syringae pv. castaneae]KPX05070.1 hypothetical protein ALO74_102651 [Pseudomonas syringae pv. cunninghamiae]KPX06009.1 hypothetical protein ALO73_102868 [Pseudomonas syringae pv. daphniphylli]KPX20123.1 hypothetical protein ALO71_102589 [Pseudomonas amygdali pv. dendropanacis]KPX29206.1 hypothetical protein ALO70_102627 [Pseudomonas amygdali pv. eriobotryae]KPX57
MAGPECALWRRDAMYSKALAFAGFIARKGPAGVGLKAPSTAT